MGSGVSIAKLAVAASLAFSVASSAFAADPAAGGKVFKRKCGACHEVGEGAATKVGPHLNGLFGRPAGSVEGYDYTAANKNSGITWTVESFDTYIRSPRTVVPGTAMNFIGLKKDKEVADIIAYLGQFSPDGAIAAD